MRDIVHTVQDLTGLAWSERATSSGTAGTYLKARSGSGRAMTYYKLSRYNGLEIDGHECVNELVASRLMGVLGIEHLAYRLIHARVSIDGKEFVTWANASANFRKAGERKLGLGVFYDLYKNPGEAPYDFCCRYGWEEAVRRMMVVDYLLINRDRHSSNIEVLVDGGGAARLAPLFDTGLSLVAPFAGDEERIRAFDPLKPVATVNFVGSRSLEANLESAASVSLPASLAEGDKDVILAGLEGVISDAHREKIWEIIWKRWERYEEIRNHR